MAPVIDGLDDLVEIGRGGFGVVYRGRQSGLGRDVAVKVLPDVRADSEAYARFARECEALAALGEHPNIVTVHSCGLTTDGAGYLAMSLLPGGSLADRVAAGPSDWREVARWGTALCGALESAHRVGITHRDIKPENVLFDAVDAPVLVDFGIAGVPGAFRTATGAVTLTLAHAAPEVVAGGRGGVPADVYSLASTLYAALAGRAAFAADGPEESLVPMVARIATAPVPDLRPAGVPAPLCAVLERAMAKDPADRPASAEELGVGLRAAAEDEGVVVPAAAVVTGAFLAGATGPRPVALGPAPTASEPTLTGWTADPAPAAAVAPTALVPAPAADDRRRGTNAWALVAGVAVVLLGLVAWRGLDLQGAPASGAEPGGSSSSPAASPSTDARPSASSTPRPTASGSATGSPSTGATAPVVHPSVSPRSSAPSSAPSASPAAVAPGAPHSLRVSQPQLASSGGAPAVSVALAFSAPSGGAQGYDVRWTVIGGSSSGSSTTVPWSSATQGRITVPVPAAGTWYRWQVRSRSAGLTSGWVTARIVVPDVVGTRAVSARPALRAQGLPSTTYAVTTTKSAAGRVLAQSSKAGSTVVAGTTVALGVGRTS